MQGVANVCQTVCLKCMNSIYADQVSVEAEDNPFPEQTIQPCPLTYPPTPGAGSRRKECGPSGLKLSVMETAKFWDSDSGSLVTNKTVRERKGSL